MTSVSAAAFLELVAGRRGHFQLESGHHSGLWLDLDSLFAAPHRVEPFIKALAHLLVPYDVDTVCGPLLGGAFLAQLVARALDVEFSFAERVAPTGPGGLYQVRYRIPSTLASRLRGKRVAMVDDVMSAGSALRGTYAELQAHGAEPVVAGALAVLGSAGNDFFVERGLGVEAVTRADYTIWLPAECPLCVAGEAIEDATAPPA